MRPENTYTIEEFIEAGKGVILTYQNLSLKNHIGENIKFPFKNVFNDYLSDIMNTALIKTVQLSDDEFNKYKYRPKILAYDIYGTTDLDFVILAINRISTPKDFTYKKINMIGKKHLNELLKSIYNAEKGLIDKYQ